MDKRKFLKLSLAGISASLIPISGKSEKTSLTAATTGKKLKIVTRTLGKTGIKLPVISSGTVPVDNINLCKEIFQSGIVHIDSAWDYYAGRSDETVGSMLKEFGRDKYIISTKILMPVDNASGQFKPEATTQAFLDQLDVSLKRLQVDYVDILYLHRPSTRNAALNAEMMNGLRKAKDQGKAKFIGLSTHNNQAEVINAAVESKFYEVILAGYNFLSDEPIKTAINNASKQGLGIVGMKVFAGGYFDKNRTNPIDKVAALKWILNDENVHTNLLTFRTFDDLNTYLPVIENFELNKNEEDNLKLAAASTTLFCIGCGNCRGKCSNSLPIPDLMRAYMYNYGYRQPGKAYKLIQSLNLSDQPCKTCAYCPTKCTRGFNLKEKIADIIRIQNVPADLLG